VLIYTCAFDDQAGASARSALFTRWHKKYLCDTLEMTPLCIKNGGDVVYGAVIIDTSFKHIDILHEHVINKADSIIAEKWGKFEN